MGLELVGGTSHRPVRRADNAPRGIIIVTGALTPERYVKSLTDNLTKAGHDAHRVHLPTVINLGIGVEKATREKAEQVSKDHKEPLVGVGYSLGGRQLLNIAYDDPELINEVHTIGSPALFMRRRKPEGVTVVNFVGRRDRVVPGFFARSLGRDEDISIDSGHLMLPYSEEVFDAINHRLSHPTTTTPTRQRLSA